MTELSAIVSDHPYRKTHEIVATMLTEKILSGELAIGQRLPPEEELTVELGIARTTLREALRVLESQGLLHIRRGRGGGPIVTHPDLGPAASALAVSLHLEGTTIGDLGDARQMIEPQVAAHLATSHGPDDIEALDEAVEAASRAAEADDKVAFAAAAARVHETLMERSGNTTMVTISRLLRELVAGYYAKATERTDQREMRRAVRSYRRFVELIEAGDRAGAVAHWQAQMAYTSEGGERDVPLPVYSTHDRR